METQNIKMLLDTNVLFQIEDNQRINNNFAAFSEKCQRHDITCFIHEATIEDINKDRDERRREITLSKVRKYPTLGGIPSPDKADLIARYGPISNDNDYIDAQLLHALAIRSVNFLITEDNGIHARAERAGLEKRVLSATEAVEWIRETYELKPVELPHVLSLRCHQVDIAQEIFNTLKSDYPGFSAWFGKCVEQHRECWVIKEEDKIIAITILKNEDGQDFKKDFVEGNICLNNDDTVLKLCTFKVDIDARGSKIGEHLLKQALWYSYENAFDWIYLTAFEDKHLALLLFSNNSALWYKVKPTTER